MTLKELRVSYNLSQKQLSIKSGLSINTIQALEQGKRDITKMKMENIKKLMNVFGNDILKLI